MSATFTLAVPTPADGTDYRFHLYNDDTPTCTNQSLGPEATAQMQVLARNYLKLFESGGLPIVSTDTLHALGTNLFDVWLADVWDHLRDLIPATGSWRLVVASSDTTVLNLPWELLQLPSLTEPLGLVPRASVRRTPRAEPLPAGTDNGRPGPLRVLYSACAPVDAGQLSYEKEEFRVLQVLTETAPKVAPFGCNLCSFDELQSEVRAVKPHVVHLTVNGFVTN